jgi:GNAT superfamily N-acetyltransferase
VVVIRPARVADAPAIAELIRSASEESFLAELPEAGRLRFLEDHTSEAMEARIRNSEFRYDIAEDAGVLAGLIGVRRGTHLFSLYVAPRMQGRGLARTMFTHVQSRASSGSTRVLTVNSSRNAVPIYEHFGFVATGGKVDADGLVYVPMHFSEA